jgi:hypothetical protein
MSTRFVTPEKLKPRRLFDDDENLKHAECDNAPKKGKNKLILDLLVEHNNSNAFVTPKKDKVSRSLFDTSDNHFVLAKNDDFVFSFDLVWNYPYSVIIDSPRVKKSKDYNNRIENSMTDYFDRMGK